MASALEGAGYLALSASLLIHPPGGYASYTTRNGVKHDITAHVTFFQQIVSSQFWAFVFGIMALGLILIALFAESHLRAAHGFLLVVVTGFAFGYFVSALQLHTGWTVAALAFVAAVSHGFFVRHRPPTVLE
jgi:hypothetical protein